MDIFLNFGLAWISVILAILLSIIYVLRISNKYFFENKNILLSKVNKALRKYHKTLGKLLVITGLVHGLYSSVEVLSSNKGTICWIISILLGVNWALRKKLKTSKGWIYYHRMLTAIFLIFIILHIVEVGGIKIHKVLLNGNNTVSYDEQISNNDSEKYNDGTYIGEAEGFNPGLKVGVEIKDNKIISIEVIEHNEVNERYWAIPVEYIPQQIIENQTIDVDIVSGATYTSTGIMNAVRHALSQAIIKGELPKEKEINSRSRRGHHH